MKKNSNNELIPALEEIQKLYEDALRSETSENRVVQSKEFFNTFRKDETNGNVTLKEDSIIKKYENFLKEEQNKQRKLIEELENLIDYEKFFLEFERNQSRNNYNGNSYTSNYQIRYRISKIEEYSRKLNEIITSSPDAWEFYYHRQLIRDIQSGYNNGLVNVKYVLDSKKRIVESLKKGTPVYIIGHLGSGKTQIAREAAVQFTLENIIQREVESEIEKWFLKNKNSSEEEAIQKFKELNEGRRNYYNKALKSISQKEIENIYPYFISGSYNLTYEDMFVERTLSLEKVSANETDIELLDKVVEQFLTWIKLHEKELEGIDKQKQELIKSKVWDSISEIFIARNSVYGTVVKKIEREILLAVKHGRPVIIDEINTIAMQNLIGLNDILQSKIGAMAYITGVGPVKIEKGFGLIGTGNLSTESVNYEGTNELNPAFKSRFLTIEYNYVNQNTLGSLKNQTNPEENELFRIILVRLADDNGSLNIPTPRRTLEELFRLAQLSKLTQNVFMGKLILDNDENSSQDVPELKESVLSLRNILRIIDNWNFGEEKDLSMALWDGFISSITNPKDQAYILSQAVRFGFFKESEGWSIINENFRNSVQEYDELRTRPYVYNRSEIETLSYLDVIKILFGPMPVRKKFPDFLEKLDSKEDEISIEEYEELDERLNRLEHSKYLLDYLTDMENNRRWNSQ